MNHRLYPSLKQIQKQEGNNQPYLISVAVRVLNEIKGIELFWKSILTQTFFDNVQFVFLDSGSTDGTLQFLKALNCDIYTIEKSEFKYGDTCNLMMELTDCESVYFFSGHVILEDPQLLEKSYNTIKANMISAYFRQIQNPFFGYSVYDKAFLKNRFPAHDNKDFLVISNKHSFSNAASVINRMHWETNNFENVLFGEDAIWANKVLESGGKIYYFNKLNVLHSHADTCEEVYKRVKMAASVKYPRGTNVFKLAYIFSKVFFAILIDSQKLGLSFKYASAHTRAYKDIQK